MRTTRDAYETWFHGERAIELVWDQYKAIILPQIGGNLIAFIDTKRKLSFLHTPTEEEMPKFKGTPYLYGIPVLFPPNRYDAGTITVNNRVYHFPINEPSKNNHLHGFMYDIPWTVKDAGVNKTASYITLLQKINVRHSVYQFWPHDFEMHLHYSLNGLGLIQHVSLRNEGKEKMPCLLGFHTALSAPFAESSTASDYRLKVTIGGRWELSERGLPTGRLLKLSSKESNMRVSGENPFSEAMDNHYSALPINGRNRMELSDLSKRVTLIYDVGSAFRQWMIWNNEAQPGFFCVEPQVNLVNAPNVEMPSEEIGLFFIEPSEIWEESSRLYCKNF